VPRRVLRGPLGVLVLSKPRGLTVAEVADRVARGKTNRVDTRPSRTVREIVRANVVTRFNAILGALLAVILVVGPLQDALFGIVLVSNTLIGIIQELRAKWTLDRLALLTAPTAAVWRDGARFEVPVEEVVLDDVLDVGPGDQIVVDGEVLAAEGLEVDESLLTGEAEPVHRHEGDVLLSGSFVVAGTGVYRAVRVGRESYAAKLAAEGKRFTLVRSDLRDGINRILRGVTWVMVPAAVLLVSSQVLEGGSVADAIRGSVAGVGSMIPEGLVLLTSVAFAVGVVRLGQRRVLVQELPAIEGLARVDIVCVDKTGTLTHGDIEVRDVDVIDAEAPVSAALGALAAADPRPNASLRAIAADNPPPAGWRALATVPFSSARKWSGATFEGLGTWVLGAPDVLSTVIGDAGAVTARVEQLAASGSRVVMLAGAPSGLAPEGGLPPALVPAALVVLGERIRETARDTLDYFAVQGVAVKVLSGDHPRTVGAIAGQLGLAGSDAAVDARRLPDDPDQLARIVEEHTVFGRVTPDQKRAMVAALQRQGHVVAMTGDGVNDVLALKDADIGVAMGGGAAATRAVAQLVLLDSTFDPLPHVVAEGRRVIANIERVGNLFLTKTVYATLLALAVGVGRLPFPFFPRHLTIVSSLTIGIPAFFLALAPATRRALPGFVGRVLRFAIPAGTVAAAATFVAYAVALGSPGVGTDESRTAATIVLFGVGWWVLAILARPLTRLKRLLLWSMLGLFAAILAVPHAHAFFALDLPSLVVIAAVSAVLVGAIAALEAGWRGSTRIERRWWPDG